MQQQIMIRELEREAKSARLLIERLPAEKFDWRPHPKVRGLADLAWHMASLPAVVSRAIQNEYQDRTKLIWPVRPDTATAMAEGFDSHVVLAKAALAKLDDAELAKPFHMMNGDTEMFGMSRGEFVRWGMLTHLVHHRAQVGLYLRMLEVQVPAMVGPSLDDLTFLR